MGLGSTYFGSRIQGLKGTGSATLVFFVYIETSSYSFFRMFDRSSKKEVTLEASRDVAKPKTMLKPRKVRDAGLFCFKLGIER